MKWLVFGKLCLIMALGEKITVHRWQKSQTEGTIALLANADGGKEDAIVIWKSENPRCFKGIDKTKLPVQ